MNVHRFQADRSARGMMLIECIVYMAMFFMIVGVASMAFFTSWTTHGELSRDADEISKSLLVGEQWRADVRGATGPIDQSVTNGAAVTRIPEPGGQVTYTFRHSELRRRDVRGLDSVLMSRVKSSAMQPEQRGAATVWRWELELEKNKDGRQMRPLFSFAAVSGKGPSQ